MGFSRRLHFNIGRLVATAFVFSFHLLLGPSSLIANELKFSFGNEQTSPGFTRVTSKTVYDAQQGYGYLDGTPAPGNLLPVIFAVDVPEGNYDVKIHFGSRASATSTTIKAESRRLMLQAVETKAGQMETRTFTVNVRKPLISPGGTTSLNSRETGPPPVPDWDEHLTLEINGPQTGVATVEITPVASALTVFLAGDSTVTDQCKEPYAGWGQMLPRFFHRGVAVSNQAESGLALSSFERQKRLKKVLSMMKKGDYLFIQFGHNDQKSKTVGAERPVASYMANLRRYVEAVRNKGGLPVLLTPMERRRWEGNQPVPTLKEYATAVRQVGGEMKVPVIDLNAMSLQLYAALGPEGSKKAFVFYPENSITGPKAALQDNTHHSVYGGYELARCVVEGIRAQVPALAAWLVKDAGTFDPAKPDAPEAVAIPLSSFHGTVEKPAGN